MTAKILPKVNYTHYYDADALPPKERKNSLQFCVAYRVYFDKVDFGVAFCSDNYEKEIGRRISLIRLNNNPITLDKDFIIKNIFTDNEEMPDSSEIDEFCSCSEFSIFKLPLRKKLIETIRLDDLQLATIRDFLVFYVENVSVAEKQEYVNECKKIPAEITEYEDILKKKQNALEALRKQKAENAEKIKASLNIPSTGK